MAEVTSADMPEVPRAVSPKARVCAIEHEENDIPEDVHKHTTHRVSFIKLAILGVVFRVFLKFLGHCEPIHFVAICRYKILQLSMA